jgi:hypothetical protein
VASLAVATIHKRPTGLEPRREYSKCETFAVPNADELIHRSVVATKSREDWQSAAVLHLDAHLFADVVRGFHRREIAQ